MDLYEAMRHRRSHRHYLPQLPERPVLERIVAAALWAPSGMNRQPWEITVMAGKKRDEFVEVVSRATRFLLPALEKAEYPEKGRELVMKFFQNLGGAPVVLAVTVFKSENPHAQNSILQSGAALMQNLLLAAEAEGLGTCWMTGANYVEDEILKFLGKTDRQLLAITPVGYPAQQPPPPARKDREVRWLGF